MIIGIRANSRPNSLRSVTLTRISPLSVRILPPGSSIELWDIKELTLCKVRLSSLSFCCEISTLISRDRTFSNSSCVIPGCCNKRSRTVSVSSLRVSRETSAEIMRSKTGLFRFTMLIVGSSASSGKVLILSTALRTSSATRLTSDFSKTSTLTVPLFSFANETILLTPLRP